MVIRITVEAIVYSLLYTAFMLVLFRIQGAKYQLYNDKPCIDDNADKCKNCLEGRIKSVGDEIMYGEWGDSPHFQNSK